MTAQLDQIVVNCRAPAALAHFWAGLLGGRAVARSDGWARVEAPNHPRLAFQRVPEEKAGPNRLHLDLAVPDPTAAARAAEERGATPVGPPVTDASGTFQVMTDPEGNEFCFTRPASGGEPDPPPATASMTLLAAAVVVHDRATGRVLLVQRGPRAKFGRGRWDLPVGKCDPGEPVARAAVRELAEETGLRVDPARLRLGHVVHGAVSAESPGGFVTVVFVAEEWSGEAVNREPEKHSAVAWFPVDDLPAEMVFSAERTVPSCLTERPAVSAFGWD